MCLPDVLSWRRNLDKRTRRPVLRPDGCRPVFRRPPGLCLRRRLPIRGLYLRRHRRQFLFLLLLEDQSYLLLAFRYLLLIFVYYFYYYVEACPWWGCTVAWLTALYLPAL